MAGTSFPSTKHLPEPGQARARQALAGLRARVDGKVRFDAGSRSAYSTDGSNYRQVRIGVVVPRTVHAAVEAVAVCREHRARVLSRGGGTSLAGECTNTAVVIDWSKYCNRLPSVDPDQRTCVVGPGIVLDDLNDPSWATTTKPADEADGCPAQRAGIRLLRPCRRLRFHRRALRRLDGVR